MSSRIGAVVEFDTKRVRSFITRPANVGPYVAGRVMSDATLDAHLTFDECARTGGGRLSGVISGARINSNANVATKPDIELWLFNADIAVVADNAAIAFTDTEMLTRIGIIQFPVANWFVGLATAGVGGNCGCEAMNLGIPYELIKSQSQGVEPKIYGQLVVRNGYIPVSGEIFTVDLLLTRD